MLSAVAAERLDLQLQLPDDVFERALDPRAFVEARDLPGGAAPRATAAVLEMQGRNIEADRRWLDNTRAALSKAELQLQDAIGDLIN